MVPKGRPQARSLPFWSPLSVAAPPEPVMALTAQRRHDNRADTPALRALARDDHRTRTYRGVSKRVERRLGLRARHTQGSELVHNFTEGGTPHTSRSGDELFEHRFTNDRITSHLLLLIVEVLGKQRILPSVLQIILIQQKRRGVIPSASG